MNAQLVWGDLNNFPVKLFLYLENGRRMCVGAVTRSGDLFIPLPRLEFEDRLIEARRYYTKAEAMLTLVSHIYEALYVITRYSELGIMEPWRVCYRIKDVDHCDVVTGYYDEPQARKVFEETRKWRGLQFVRLEKNGVAEAFFAP